MENSTLLVFDRTDINDSTAWAIASNPDEDFNEPLLFRTNLGNR